MEVEVRCIGGAGRGEHTGRMIQIRKAENEPKKAMTLPKPGKATAVAAHTAVVMILEMILYIVRRLSGQSTLCSDKVEAYLGLGDVGPWASWSAGGIGTGAEMDDLNIWDSSPGVEGLMDKSVSIVTFN